MGFVVDLSVMWEPYKAAAAALRNTMDMAVVREVHARQVDPHPALYTPSPINPRAESGRRTRGRWSRCRSASRRWRGG